MDTRYTSPMANVNQSWTAVSDFKVLGLMRTTALFPTTDSRASFVVWSVLQKCAWASAGFTMMVKLNKVDRTQSVEQEVSDKLPQG